MQACPAEAIWIVGPPWGKCVSSQGQPSLWAIVTCRRFCALQRHLVSRRTHQRALVSQGDPEHSWLTSRTLQLVDIKVDKLWWGHCVTSVLDQKKRTLRWEKGLLAPGRKYMMGSRSCCDRLWILFPPPRYLQQGTAHRLPLLAQDEQLAGVCRCSLELGLPVRFRPYRFSCCFKAASCSGVGLALPSCMSPYSASLVAASLHCITEHVIPSS